MITRPMSVHKEDPFLQLAELFRSSDVGYANLAMLMHNFEHSPGSGGGTYTGSDPSNISELEWLGVNLVSTANNHSYDYGENGVITNINHLENSQITYAGTGKNLSEARSPAYLETANGRVALISTTSTFPDSARALDQRPDALGRPGLNPQRFTTHYHVDKTSFEQLRKINKQLGLEEKRIALRNFRPQGFVSEDNENEFTFLGKKFVSGKTFAEHTNLNESDMNEHIKWIKDAKRMANWVIMSFHCHESGEVPSDPPEFLVDFAHRCIDAGVDIFLGHGPHITRGVEIYKDKPIFYSLGNFIFQNDTVKWQPSQNYDIHNLDFSSTPADFYDARSNYGSRGFVSNSIYWESIVTKITFDSHKLSSVQLYPINLGHGKSRAVSGRPLLSDNTLGNTILGRIKYISEKYGTTIKIHDNIGEIEL